MAVDPERELSYYWVKHKKLPGEVPSVVGPNGEKVYQIKHVPLKTVDKPIKYNKKAGLGGFHAFSYRWLREFLDDYLSIADILRLGCVSKEWAFYCSDEKYVPCLCYCCSLGGLPRVLERCQRCLFRSSPFHHFRKFIYMH
jgi:hypothetical protein